MLEGRRDEVHGLVVLVGNPLDGEIGGLRGAAGEDDLFGVGANQVGDVLACRFDCSGSPSATRVLARWIGKNLAEIGGHGLEDSFIDGGRGGVVEVDHGLGILPQAC